MAARIASEDLGNWAAAAKHAGAVLQQHSNELADEERTLCETIVKVSRES